MSVIALKTLQFRGKVRRFIDGKVRTEAKTQDLLSKRQGECNRCGACCKILFRCPFLGTDAEGQYTCRIYEHRFTQCRLFPLHPQDLKELGEQCSYTFDTAPAAAPGASPEPAPAD